MQDQEPITSGQRARIVEEIFEQVAETLGDITKPVMQRAYEAFPEAKQSFKQHGLGEKLSDLEAVMVEQTLYCVIGWVESPGASKVTLDTTVPHHAETLNVPLPFFWSIFTALFDLVKASIPAADKKKIEVLTALQAEIEDYVHNSISLSG